MPILHRIVKKVKSIYHFTIFGTNRDANSAIIHFGKHIPDRTHHGLKGGAVKLQRLQEHFKVSVKKCNILYLVSSSLPPRFEQWIKVAKRRNIAIVWNQNGVSYPASQSPDWQNENHRMKSGLHQADYVIYQSQFCKESADEFLGAFTGPSQIIYNSVDTSRFSEKKNNARKHSLTLLLGGNQYAQYRLETAIRTIAILAERGIEAKLIVTGKVAWDGKSEKECRQLAANLIQGLGIQNQVEFTGQYEQSSAPEIYGKADILLHTKWRDPCPGLVIEAMACGLPVVYSKSGGMPELVDATSGIGVSAGGSWEQIDPPDPQELAEAVICISEDLENYSRNARKRAKQLFDIDEFIESHRVIFKEVLTH